VPIRYSKTLNIKFQQNTFRYFEVLTRGQQYRCGAVGGHILARLRSKCANNCA